MNSRWSLLLILGIGCLPTAVPAACPRVLTGTYSGYAIQFSNDRTETELIEVSFVNATTVTVNYLLAGASGDTYEFSGPDSPSLPEAVPYTYNGRRRGTVSRNSPEGLENVHFLVADNGRILHMMRKLERADGPPYETTIYTFTRQ